MRGAHRQANGGWTDDKEDSGRHSRFPRQAAELGQLGTYRESDQRGVLDRHRPLPAGRFQRRS